MENEPTVADEEDEATVAPIDEDRISLARLIVAHDDIDDEMFTVLSLVNTLLLLRVPPVKLGKLLLLLLLLMLLLMILLLLLMTETSEWRC